MAKLNEDVSPRTEREQILESMSRTLFVTSYADAWDRKELPAQVPHAGPGDEWFACAPEGTPPVCRVLAADLVRCLEEHNKMPLEQVFAINCEQPDHLCAPTLDSFAHYLVMECLGHGVGWADDHPEHGLALPTLETFLTATDPAKVGPKRLAEGLLLDEFDGGPLLLELEYSGPRYLGDEGPPNIPNARPV